VGDWLVVMIKAKGVMVNWVRKGLGLPAAVPAVRR